MELHPNEIINSLRICISLRNSKSINTVLISAMQSGKTGTVYVLVNYILTSLGFLKPDESVVLLTSMRDISLYNQNINRLQKDYYSFLEKQHVNSKIRVVKMNEFLNYSNIIVRDFNVKYIIRDEDQYGCGIDSSFDQAFFKELRESQPNIPLICISATPYDMLDAKDKGEDIEVVEGYRSPSYFGIPEMLSDGIVHDLPKNYKPISFDKYDSMIKYVHPIINKSIKFLESFDDGGVGIIRVNSTKTSLLLKDELINSISENTKILIIGSSSDCDYEISEGLDKMKELVNRKNKKIILIIIQALAAGKDLKYLKCKVRFGIESRKSQLANCAQGIPGRLCGYHDNRNFIIYANKPLLEHYSDFEDDYEVFSNEQWKNDLKQFCGVNSASTQVKFKQETKRGYVSNVQNVYTFSIEDLLNTNILDDLKFISKSSLDKIIALFEKSYYSEYKKNDKINDKELTVRVASNYKKQNRVYNEWSSGVGDNFNSIFFHKSNDHKYGILTSNYPDSHIKNKIGYSGIKVFKPGKQIFVESKTITENSSMHIPEKENEIRL